MSVEDGRITNRAAQGKADKSRYIRPVERQRMRPWLMDHLEKNDVPGLSWQNRNQWIFRISWKHAANQCFHLQTDTNLFERWAIHTGACQHLEFVCVVFYSYAFVGYLYAVLRQKLRTWLELFKWTLVLIPISVSCLKLFFMFINTLKLKTKQM